MCIIFFQDSLTTKSPIFKQLKCGIAACGRKAERRVTLATCTQIFLSQSDHVPVGSGGENILMNFQLNPSQLTSTE